MMSSVHWVTIKRRWVSGYHRPEQDLLPRSDHALDNPRWRLANKRQYRRSEHQHHDHCNGHVKRECRRRQQKIASSISTILLIRSSTSTSRFQSDYAGRQRPHFSVGGGSFYHTPGGAIQYDGINNQTGQPTGTLTLTTVKITGNTADGQGGEFGFG